MSGTVSRGKSSTRFHLVVELENGSYLEEVKVIDNLELDCFRKLYAFVLDKMVTKLDERLNDRHQSWLRQ